MARKSRQRIKPRISVIDMAQRDLEKRGADWFIPRDPTLQGDFAIQTEAGPIGLWVARTPSEAHVLRMGAPFPEPFFPCQVVAFDPDESEAYVERVISMAIARARGRLDSWRGEGRSIIQPERTRPEELEVSPD